MIHHVRERFPRNGHPKVLHVREIRLGTLSWAMSLFKDHFLIWSMQRSPSGDMPSQRAVLRGTIPTRMFFTEQSKQRGGLQC